jgi:anti-sigma regulatory factor (Ser/Thr protein kinase)
MSAVTAPPAAHLWLSPGPHAPRAARDALQSVAGLDEDVRSTAALLLSELVTNAVRHAGLGPDDAIEVTISVGEALRVEVADPGPGVLQRRAVSRPDGDHGRGLFIVARLARRWGIDRTEQGRVWFELDASPDWRSAQAATSVQSRGG